MKKLIQFEYKRTFNLGQYESETIGFTYAIDEDDLDHQNIEKLIEGVQKLAIKNSIPIKRKKQNENV